MSAWNICETRNGSNQTTYQYVWGTKYTDELITIEKNLGPTVDDDADVDTLSDAESGPSPNGNPADLRYLVHQDRNWNVIALSDYDHDSSSNDPVIVERYSYTPYGRFVILRGDSSGNQLGNVLLTSAVGNVFAHQGLPMDREKGSYQNRRRTYGALNQRFSQRDPAGYSDGPDLYNYTGTSPALYVDPLGRDVVLHGPTTSGQMNIGTLLNLIASRKSVKLGQHSVSGNYDGTRTSQTVIPVPCGCGPLPLYICSVTWHFEPMFDVHISYTELTATPNQFQKMPGLQFLLDRLNFLTIQHELGHYDIARAILTPFDTAGIGIACDPATACVIADLMAQAIAEVIKRQKISAHIRAQENYDTTDWPVVWNAMRDAIRDVFDP